MADTGHVAVPVAPMVGMAPILSGSALDCLMFTVNLSGLALLAVASLVVPL